MDKEHLILLSAQQNNILPLTSQCDAACIFCSHKQNPPGVKVFSIKPRTLSEAEYTMDFLNKNEKIVIGESATKIIEGEPFTHPRIREILRLLRRKFPAAPLSITTNGHYLTEETAAFLKEISPLEINLSLNSASVEGRVSLMGDEAETARQSIEGAKWLRKYGIPFHGSIVAMPHIIGWDDLAGTILYLNEMSCETIRVFLPGFSKRAEERLKFDPGKMHRELNDFVNGMRERVACPLLLEPPILADLRPFVAGVIQNSPADKAGLQRGDLIQEVNGKQPGSRVEAFFLMKKPGKIRAKIERTGRTFFLEWQNEEGARPGMVMEYDFDLSRLERLRGIVEKYPDLPVAIFSSALAAPMMKQVLALLPERQNLFLRPVENIFFGGSINTSGLLTTGDFIREYQNCRQEKIYPEVMILPGEAFDQMGKDLLGVSYLELEMISGMKAELA